MDNDTVIQWSVQQDRWSTKGVFWSDNIILGCKIPIESLVKLFDDIEDAKAILAAQAGEGVWVGR